MLRVWPARVLSASTRTPTSQVLQILAHWVSQEMHLLPTAQSEDHCWSVARTCKSTPSPGSSGGPIRWFPARIRLRSMILRIGSVQDTRASGRTPWHRPTRAGQCRISPFLKADWLQSTITARGWGRMTSRLCQPEEAWPLIRGRGLGPRTWEAPR